MNNSFDASEYIINPLPMPSVEQDYYLQSGIIYIVTSDGRKASKNVS